MKKMLLVLFGALTTSALAAPEITALTVEAKTGWIKPDSTISFTLGGTAGEKAIVTFALEKDGEIVDCPYVTVTGDDCLNRVIEQGTYSFKWDSSVDWPEHKIETNTCRIVVKAWNLKSPPDYLVYDLKNKSNQPRYYQKATDVPGGVTATVYKTDKLVMRRIHAAGKEFLMGMNSGYEPDTYSSNSKPTMVGFTKDYYIGIYELTFGQHINVKANGNNAYVAYSNNYGPGKAAQNDALMAEVTSTTDVARSRAAALTQYYYYWSRSITEASHSTMILYAFQSATKNTTLRLPTHAEWEYACRAGNINTPYYDVNCKRDEANVGRFAWYAENNEDDPDWYYQSDTGLYLPHVVGLKTPNAWGLYDMLGNVHEQTLDAERNPGMQTDKTTIVDYRPTVSSFTSDTQLWYAGGSLNSDLTGNNYNVISCGFIYPLRSGTGALNLGHRLRCDVEATW